MIIVQKQNLYVAKSKKGFCRYMTPLFLFDNCPFLSIWLFLCCVFQHHRPVVLKKLWAILTLWIGFTKSVNGWVLSLLIPGQCWWYCTRWTIDISGISKWCMDMVWIVLVYVCFSTAFPLYAGIKQKRRRIN